MTIQKFNDISAMEALKKAQSIAMGPFVFQAVAAMEELGILKALADLPPGESITREELSGKTGISLYAVGVLTDLAVTADILIEREEKDNGIAGEDGGNVSEGKVCSGAIRRGLMLSKVGIYLAHDPMTRVNLSFTRHVCYQGLVFLAESLKNGRPEGLRIFTEDHDTIYPFLSSLPEKAREAWFAFDHFYSDRLFPAVIPELFKMFCPGVIYDVGGNTGKFALAATDYDSAVRVTIIDLPEQCAIARGNIKSAGREERIDVFPVNILEPDPELPGDADVWWLSQFLDCFSTGQISFIVSRIARAAKSGAILAVNEILGDRQKNDVASLVIDASSLYFTALANGVSRFYHARDLIPLIEMAGFSLCYEMDHLGMGHSVLFFRKK